ncbi:hypothetical protein RD792_015801 [Penstemon davidsonii]|uniref:Dirigent protein n=1 Tax=Penstemon davidsonii TaxID=160366 RepID=A0ABR0CHM9_9LAMI|nr:hypothetical protein RD792_015801 [Penstemon davidsonii]
MSFITLFFSTLCFFSTLTEQKFSEQYPATKAATLEKTTHLHFYFHDIVSGKHPSTISVAGTKNAFGNVVIIDDPLTEGHEAKSKIVGRAQGSYAFSCQDKAGLLMVMTFAFEEGKYNGSSVSVLGRNRFLEKVREMPIVGGSGIFRFGRGYALAKTVRYNVKTGDAVVEYNMFVMHY